MTARPSFGMEITPREFFEGISTALAPYLPESFSLPVVAGAVVTALIFAFLVRRRAKRRHAGADLGRTDRALHAQLERRARRLTGSEMILNGQDALGWGVNELQEDASDGDSDPASPHVVGQQKIILIADDDPVVVIALSHRLQHLGYRVLRSPDAAHALLGVMKCLPDLVILDVNMPSGNGLAVCEMMASDPRFAGIPTIIHSTFSDETTKERCLKLGAHHVQKSSRSWVEIKKLVESLIGADRAVATDSTLPKTPADEPDVARDVQEEAPAPTLAPQVPPQRSPQPRSPKTTSRKNGARPAEASVSDAHYEDRDVPQHDAQPSEATQRGPSGNTQRQPAQRTCEPCRVICIESPSGQLEWVEHQLTALGMSVTRINDLVEGYWTCFTDRPQAVIVQAADQPDALRTLLQSLATHPVTRSLPVLLLNDDNVIDRKQAGTFANLKLLKSPMQWEELLSQLDAFTSAFSGQPEDPLSKIAKGDISDLRGPTAPEVDQAEEVDDVRPPTVLCIDDDPVVARSIALRMEPYGITVWTANNGTQGYLTAIAQQPNFILLDLKLPNGDGTYVLSKLQGNPHTQSIPILMLTMETHPGIRRNLLACGVRAFLSKPIRWAELFAEMERCGPLPRQLLTDYHLLEPTAL